MIRRSKKNRVDEKKFQTLLPSRRYVGGKSRGAREGGRFETGKMVTGFLKKLSPLKILHFLTH
jgi:hypothetical protein